MSIRPVPPPIQTDTDYFIGQLAANKHRIDADSNAYWQHNLADIKATYGPASERAVQVLAEIMTRGGKRIRASLAETSYRMFGGTDTQVIRGMGLALEMIHAYVLIIDDICDRSNLRRGGPTAHKLLESWHRTAGFHGDSEHFGTSIATLAALVGSHQAMLEISALPLSAERKLAALDNLNRLLITTCHGQFNDIANEADPIHDPQRIEDTLLWKTAYYTFGNPLQLGAILAGAPPAMLDRLMNYSLAAGQAFQISDDILGLFGDPKDTGKNPADDIKEGKRTLLVTKAIELAPTADAAFLESQLGNDSLTPEAFDRCKAVIRASGVLAFAQRKLEDCCDIAAKRATGSGLPSGDGVRFLAGLTTYLKDRTA